MIDLVIVGTSKASALIACVIEREAQANVLAYTTYRSMIKETSLEGKPIVAIEDLNELYDMKSVYVLNTIGYTDMNTVRERVFKDTKERFANIYTFISKNALIYTDKIGKGSIVMPGAYVGPYVEVGESCLIMAQSSVPHHIKVEDYSYIAARAVIGGTSIIGHNSFIGINATVKNKVNLAPYTLIGSGSNVLDSITEECCVVVGNPAKILPNKRSYDSKI